MARTRLFATVQRLLRRHARAHALGIDLATLEERDRAAVSRRQFLGTAGAATALLALPRFARGQMAGGGATDGGLPGNPRIAIVGAGISGLNAALTLANANAASNLTIYEASNRIGGRMYSNSPAMGSGYWDDSQVSEWCGELIDDADTTIQGLAQTYGLPLDNLLAAAPNNSTQVFYFNGGYYSEQQLNTDFAPVFKTILTACNAAIPNNLADGSPNTDDTVLWNAITPTGIQLDNTSLYNWIATNVPGGYSSNLAQLLDAAYATEFACDTTGQSSLNMILDLGSYTGTGSEILGSSDEIYHVRGGNQQIPLAIASDLQTRLGANVIQLNSVLTRIARNPDGTVALTFAVTSGGKTTNVEVDADAVILTLPFAVLADSVDYSCAGFDARKTQAIQQLGRGLASKLQLQFTSRLWNSPGAWGTFNQQELYSDVGDQCSWDVTRGQPGADGILVGFSGGTPATVRATAAPVAFGVVNAGTYGTQIATLATTLLGQLNQIFPGVTPLYNGLCTLSLPHLAPNFKLAYSYWAVGQYQAFAGYERTPQGNIFFAGEHTSVNNQGSMEGAAEEGARAGQQVIAAAEAATLLPAGLDAGVGAMCDADAGMTDAGGTEVTDSGVADAGVVDAGGVADAGRAVDGGAMDAGVNPDGGAPASDAGDTGVGVITPTPGCGCEPGQGGPSVSAALVVGAAAAVALRKGLKDY